jgi:hypothetical protein
LAPANRLIESGSMINASLKPMKTDRAAKTATPRHTRAVTGKRLDAKDEWHGTTHCQRLTFLRQRVT